MTTPRVSGGNIPEPYNENDVYIINALISKFLCEADFFNREAFLKAMIKGSIKPSVKGYSNESLKQAVTDTEHSMNHLISHCLRILSNLGLVREHSRTIYIKTVRLHALCPKIKQYDMPYVEGLVKELADIESQLRKDKSYESIVRLLEQLRRRRINKRDTALSNSTLKKLSQLGVINMSLNDMVSLSNIGKVLTI